MTRTRLSPAAFSQQTESGLAPRRFARAIAGRPACRALAALLTLCLGLPGAASGLEAHPPNPDVPAPQVYPDFRLEFAPPKKVGNKRSQDLKRLVDEYLEGLFRSRPHLATYMGDHRFDDLLMDLSPGALARRQAKLRSQRQRVEALARHPLLLDDAINARLMRDAIDLELLYLTDIRDWTWDPRLSDSIPYYDPREIIATRLSNIMHGDFASFSKRRRSVVRQIEQLPGFLSQMRAALSHPAKIYVDQAIEDNAGRIEFFQGELAAFLRGDAHGEQALARAVDALKQYQVFLTDTLLPKADGDWRLGEARYRKKFSLALQTAVTPDALLEEARRSLKEDQLELFRLAGALYRELFPGAEAPPDTPAGRLELLKKVQDALSKDHPEAGQLVKSHAEHLDALRAFIADQKLLELPPARTLTVEEMPAYKRGGGGAEYLAPGILDPRSSWKGVYYVEPVDSSWPTEKVDSYLRANNRYEIDLTAAHEAYPGHHTQAWYERQHLEPLRATLWSGPMAEGWAVYAEQLLVRRGYGGEKGGGFRFFELRGNLVVAANVILDIELHRGRMTDEQALELLTGEAFSERAEAEEKLQRARLDSTQLCQYFLGVTEIQRLEADYRAKVGDAFDQRVFDEALIGHGSLPVPYLRELVLAGAGAERGARP